MIKLKVDTHDGNSFEVEVEEYDADDLNEKLNDNFLNTAAIGDLVISRIIVKTVIPIEVEKIDNELLVE